MAKYSSGIRTPLDLNSTKQLTWNHEIMKENNTQIRSVLRNRDMNFGGILEKGET